MISMSQHLRPAPSTQGGRRRKSRRCGYPRQHRQSVTRRSTGETDWESTSSYEDLGGSRRRLLTTAVESWRRGANHQVCQSRCQNSTVSHTLEGISNQSSTAVPAQINSSRRGLTPAAEVETCVQADPLRGNREWYDVILVKAGELKNC